MVLSRHALIRWLSFVTGSALTGCSQGMSAADMRRTTAASTNERTAAIATKAHNAPKLSVAEKQAFRATEPRWWVNLPKPDGISEEREPGRHYFSGNVTFKLQHRVIEGRVKSFTWENGIIKLRGVHDSGSPYQFSILPDLTNTKVSTIFVGD